MFFEEENCRYINLQNKHIYIDKPKQTAEGKLMLLTLDSWKGILGHSTNTWSWRKTI